jgi:hypothetical protein
MANDTTSMETPESLHSMIVRNHITVSQLDAPDPEPARQVS